MTGAPVDEDGVDPGWLPPLVLSPTADLVEGPCADASDSPELEGNGNETPTDSVALRPTGGDEEA